VRIAILLLMFIQISVLSSAQDLISRTMEGLSCQSTEEPNAISKKISPFKASHEINLFSWDNRKATYEEDRVSLKLNRGLLRQLKSTESGQISIDIPVSPDRSFSLQVYPVQIQSSDGQLLTPDGPIKSQNKMRFFRGVIEGDHGSLVTVSMINEDVQFSIADQDGVYRIAPADFKSDLYAIWVDRSQSERTMSCGTDQLLHEEISTVHYPVTNNRKAADDIIEVYIECDNRLRSNKGGVPNTEIFVNQLMAEVITLYANENINMQVSDIFVWTSPDPYANNQNLGVVLPQFATNKQNNYNGRLATLLKGDIANNPNSCSVAGLAWINVLCGTYQNHPTYGISGPYNANTGVGDCPLTSNPTVASEAIDVSLVAHELGHNIGSPHTHSCSWGPNNNQAIDMCPGFFDNGPCTLVTTPTPPNELSTIMSYCDNAGIPTVFSKGFGTEPGNLMRNRVAAASCLLAPGPSCTENNLVYNGGTVPNNTVEYSNSNITLNNSVSIANNATVFWQAENEFVVNGDFTVPGSSVLEVVSDECQE